MKLNELGVEPVKALLIGVVTLLAFTNIVTVYLYLSQPKNPKNVTSVANEGLLQITDSNQIPRGVISTSTASPTAEVKLPTEKFTVDWQAWPVKQNSYNVVSSEQWKTAVNENSDPNYSSQSEYVKAVLPQYESSMDFYLVGQVNSGKYAGGELLLGQFTGFEGPAYKNTYRIIKASSSLIVIAGQSVEIYDDVLKKIFTVDKSLEISNLEPGSEINIPGSKTKLIKATKEPGKMLTDYKDAKKVLKLEGDKYLYLSKDAGCFVAAANDGTAREYFYDQPLVAITDPASQYAYAEVVSSFEVRWLTGTTTKVDYAFSELGGCGQHGCYKFADFGKEKPAQILVAAGTFANGDTIYEPAKNSIDKPGVIKTALENLYDNSYYPGWDSENNKAKEKMPYSEFLTTRPLLYWQDPFGNYVQLEGAMFIPQTECGKPVIYLYPTKTSTVAVLVQPNGGFSVTEPEYGTGWKVEAKPNGELTNLSDGKKYPYLFWEGRALAYERPTNGFVVKKAEVKKLLVEKLAQLGLNQKESAEFMEYWLPRMQAKPYYFVTFLPQNQFEKLAPLNVEPKPDTVIRVFMDYQGLDAPIKVEPLAIKTPKRLGFTVVEWGGALHN